MTCAGIMTPAPRTLCGHDAIGAAADHLIRDQHINMPVVDGDGALIGLFGIYDLLALLVPRIAMVGDLIPNLRFMSDDMAVLRERLDAIRRLQVAQAMNKEPICVNPETPIVEAIRLFCRNHMTIPVVESRSKTLVGIISYWDVAKFLSGPRTDASRP